MRDFGVLEGAFESAFRALEGKELYPTKEKSRAQAYTLIANHYFLRFNTDIQSKKQIRTVLSLRNGSDLFVLVEIVGFEPMTS